MCRMKLQNLVSGAINNARMQANRERFTHGGLASSGRRVLDEFPDEIVASTSTLDDVETNVDVERQRQIIRRQIRECEQKAVYVVLAERHLFNGESIVPLANELKIKPGTALSVVLRVKKYLGLK